MLYLNFYLTIGYGFHALISSGTTSKMLENETHALPVIWFYVNELMKEQEVVDLDYQAMNIQRNHPDKQVQSRGDFLTEVFTSVLNQLFFYKF